MLQDQQNFEYKAWAAFYHNWVCLMVQLTLEQEVYLAGPDTIGESEKKSFLKQVPEEKSEV